MPRVSIAGSAGDAFTGGVREFDVAATSFRRLVQELDSRFPGFGPQIENSMALAVDGTIYQDAYGATFGPDSEVVLIPRISGG